MVVTSGMPERRANASSSPAEMVRVGSAVETTAETSAAGRPAQLDAECHGIGVPVADLDRDDASGPDQVARPGPGITE